MGDVPTVIARKLARAEEHCEALNERINDFLKAKPCVAIRQVEMQGLHHVYTARISRPPPGDLWVQVGEILYQCRSALDHIAWELVQRAIQMKKLPPLTQAAEKKVQFPIHTARSRWTKDVGNRLPHVDPPVIAVVESLQPFKRGYGSTLPLVLLNQLSNIDKHRVPIFAFTAPSWYHWPVNPGTPQPIETRKVPSALEDGAEFLRLIFAQPEPHVDMEVDFIFDVSFEEKGPTRGSPVVPQLRRIYEDVRDRIIPALSPFL